jgi:hypothetical protein
MNNKISVETLASDMVICAKNLKKLPPRVYQDLPFFGELSHYYQAIAMGWASKLSEKDPFDFLPMDKHQWVYRQVRYYQNLFLLCKFGFGNIRKFCDRKGIPFPYHSPKGLFTRIITDESIKWVQGEKVDCIPDFPEFLSNVLTKSAIQPRYLRKCSRQLDDSLGLFEAVIVVGYKAHPKSTLYDEFQNFLRSCEDIGGYKKENPESLTGKGVQELMIPIDSKKRKLQIP